MTPANLCCSYTIGKSRGADRSSPVDLHLLVLSEHNYCTVDRQLGILQ